MNYIKIIFISFVVMYVSFFYAQEVSLVSSDNAATSLEVAAKDNELENWNNHLKKLENNWDVSANKPNETWMKDAITIATDTLRINKDLAQTLKDSFINAIKKQNAELTPETAELISSFNNAIKKELEEPILETTKEEEKIEPLTPAIKPVIEIPTEPEPQPEAPAPEMVTPAAETPAEPSPVTPETEKPARSEPTQEETEKNFKQEWNICLQNIESSKGDIETLSFQAIELAQKLRNTINIATLVEEFETALNRATYRRKSFDKDGILNYFKSMLGMYVPDFIEQSYYYQLASSQEFQQLQQKQAKQAEMQRKREKMQHEQKIKQEQDIRAAQSEKELIKQKALLQAEEQKRLSESQLLSLELKRAQKEQQIAAESLRQLRQEADQLKAELKKAAQQQKAAAEKSYFTAFTEYLWGTGETPISEETINAKKEQLQQLTREIEKKEKKLSEQHQKSSEQYKKQENTKSRIAQELTDIELKRQEELKKERDEIAQLNASKEFKILASQWRDFLTRLEHNHMATREDNDNATKEAISRAENILRLIPQFVPKADLSYKSSGLKQSFINALLIQQKDRENPLNIFINQAQFDNAINNFVEHIIKS